MPASPALRSPGSCARPATQYWAGLRPATPSNVPYIGASTTRNLFLNTGHGTLGWTHACGSGAAIADIISGRVPEVDFAFTGQLRERQPMSMGKPAAAST